MKKFLICIALISIILGTTACNNTSPKETVISLTETEPVTESASEIEAGDLITPDESNQVANQELYDFNLNVYFSEEPNFNDSLSCLEVDLGFEFAGGEYNTVTRNSETNYYDCNSNLIASVINNDNSYSIKVYDSNVTFNISALTGPSNEGLEYLCADIETDGDKYSYLYADNAYRSYTGVWLMGIANIKNGEIGEYDASRMQN